MDDKFEESLDKTIDETVTTGAIADFTTSAIPNDDASIYSGRKKKKEKKKEKKEKEKIEESYNDNYHRQMDRRWRTDGQADGSIQFWEDDNLDGSEKVVPEHEINVEPIGNNSFMLSVEGPDISIAEELPKSEITSRIEEIKDRYEKKKAEEVEGNIAKAFEQGKIEAKRAVLSFGPDRAEEDMTKMLSSEQYIALLASLRDGSVYELDEVVIQNAYYYGYQYVITHPETKSRFK